MTGLLDVGRGSEPIDSIDAYWTRLRALPQDTTTDRAILGGCVADRVGYAFAGGYDSALRALVPAGVLPANRVAALCATETGGGRPRNIATRLEGGRVSGDKSFVTLGTSADLFFVVASIATEEQRATGRSALKLVRVARGSDGVTIEPLPPTPFAPEIAHARVTLRGVEVDDEDMLPGDGYDAYLKPFRTIEDIHVLGAMVGYLVGVARRYEWPRAFVARLLAVASALRALGAASPSSLETHVGLAGAFELVRALLRESDESDAHWATAHADERARWERDRAILTVADTARTLRLEAAWRRIDGMR